MEIAIPEHRLDIPPLCPICLGEETQDNPLLPVSHERNPAVHHFHRYCIGRWLFTPPNPKNCPLCQDRITAIYLSNGGTIQIPNGRAIHVPNPSLIRRIFNNNRVSTFDIAWRCSVIISLNILMVIGVYYLAEAARRREI